MFSSTKTMQFYLYSREKFFFLLQNCLFYLVNTFIFKVSTVLSNVLLLDGKKEWKIKGLGHTNICKWGVYNFKAAATPSWITDLRYLCISYGIKCGYREKRKSNVKKIFEHQQELKLEPKQIRRLGYQQIHHQIYHKK